MEDGGEDHRAVDVRALADGQAGEADARDVPLGGEVEYVCPVLAGRVGGRTAKHFFGPGESRRR